MTPRYLAWVPPEKVVVHPTEVEDDSLQLLRIFRKRNFLTNLEKLGERSMLLVPEEQTQKNS